jgi:alpha- and gamma-adaptin-binding protein p34
VSVDDLDSEFGDFESDLNTRKEVLGPASGRGSPDLDPESLDFGFDRADFVGLKQAIWNAGKEDDDSLVKGQEGKRAAEDSALQEEELDDDEVQKIERMMVKLQAVRDTSAGLTEDQRKRLAAKAVSEVMREL